MMEIMSRLIGSIFLCNISVQVFFSPYLSLSSIIYSPSIDKTEQDEKDNPSGLSVWICLSSFEWIN